jgi:hypothetical protein
MGLRREGYGTSQETTRRRTQASETDRRESQVRAAVRRMREAQNLGVSTLQKGTKTVVIGYQNITMHTLSICSNSKLNDRAPKGANAGLPGMWVLSRRKMPRFQWSASED